MLLCAEPTAEDKVLLEKLRLQVIIDFDVNDIKRDRHLLEQINGGPHPYITQEYDMREKRVVLEIEYAKRELLKLEGDVNEEECRALDIKIADLFNNCDVMPLRGA